MKSRVLGDDFGMRFFMCENYKYDPPKHYSKDRAKVLQNTILCILNKAKTIEQMKKFM